jgi:hypothetical protein
VDDVKSTVAGGPFAHAGSRCEDQDHPHGCHSGVVYIGHMVEDPETGEEVEAFEPVRCRRCGVPARDLGG